MQDTIVTIYYLCDQVLEALGHQDGQCRLSRAEAMTVPVVALHHGGNQALTRRFLHGHGYFRHALSASRFDRRMAAVPQAAWEMVMALLRQVFKANNPSGDYIIGSMPVAACCNACIRRCRLFPEKITPICAATARAGPPGATRLIPTPVGNTRAHSCEPPACTAHPHARGEHRRS